jgi:hypothetical protein
MVNDLSSKSTDWGCNVNNPNGIPTFISNTPYAVAAPGNLAYFSMNSNRQLNITDILLIKSIPFILVRTFCRA